MKNKTLRGIGIVLMVLPFLFIVGGCLLSKEYVAAIILGCCYIFIAGLLLLLEN